jgi:hypothetical protein
MQLPPIETYTTTYERLSWLVQMCALSDPAAAASLIAPYELLLRDINRRFNDFRPISVSPYPAVQAALTPFDSEEDYYDFFASE